MKDSSFKSLKYILALILLLISLFTFVSLKTSYVKEDFNDRHILHFIGRYKSENEDGSRGVAEIVKYDKMTKKVFIANGSEGIDVIDLSNFKKDSTENLQLHQRIKIRDISAFEDFEVNDITSVAVHPKEDYIVASLANKDKTKKGRVIFFTKSGEYRGFATVGYLPDNINFTPNGKYLLVANEGEVTDDASVDPEGSVSMIDVSKGIELSDEFNVDNITFDNVQIDKDVVIEKVTESSQAKHDFEPEYLIIDEKSEYAYIALQENNAIAKLDIKNKKFERIYGLGFKDYSLSGLDASDKNTDINIKPWPVLGMYQPDGIDIAKIGNKEYIFTANEGDKREYGAYKNEMRVENIETNLKLDSKYYDGYSQKELDEIMESIKHENNLGRLKINPYLGKDKNGDYEALYSFGTRSFSIWNSEDLKLVYDSGDDFEQVTAIRLPEYFNISNSGLEKKSKSDNRGPEPEDVRVGKVGDKFYAFIGLEYIGGIMVYDVTNPEESKFKQYITTRDYTKDVGGDSGPEGLEFISETDSPIDTPLLLAANEVSGTLAIYGVNIEREDKK